MQAVINESVIAKVEVVTETLDSRERVRICFRLSGMIERGVVNVCVDPWRREELDAIGFSRRAKDLALDDLVTSGSRSDVGSRCYETLSLCRLRIEKFA